MIHASRELVAAMRGEAPNLYPPFIDDHIRACDGVSALAFVVPAFYLGVPSSRQAMSGSMTVNDVDADLVIDCPRCLALMRDATDPVRWDWLEERGLVSAA